MPKQIVTSFNEFFQQELNCEVLVQSLYDLNHLEFSLYCSLLQLGKADVTILMEKAGRKDRTMVNRALTSLLDKDLCMRDKKSQPGQRGYWYIYSATPLIILKKKLLRKLEKWYDYTTDAIMGIEERFDEVYGSINNK
ncbi:MAG: hypothetical protein HeimC2_33500 [Candidatus Heimdallarchaeota archaeon LC_2]|nr:MAG: hypothetical protein HeimC2_33500 [Candidatus Heimdallarchaeota archaeon LC_2]